MWKKSKDEQELIIEIENRLLRYYKDELKSKTRRARVNEIFIRFKNNFLVDMNRRIINLQKNRFNYISKY